ncbi:MAG: ATP-binding protein [Bdellovibrionaceae bacterium]|nr:ATP-binding protein [Pseudobdellovibrionaceae bacterium]
MRFPWSFFLRLWLTQAFVYPAVFVILQLIFFPKLSLSVLLLELVGILLVSSLVSALIAYRFTRPFRRVLHKAMSIASRKWAKEHPVSPEELLSSDGQSYQELESILDRIDKKLRRRKDELIREREENEIFMNSVREGIISLDERLEVRYYNSRFAEQFLDSEKVKSDRLQFVEIFRDPHLIEALRKALLGESVDRVPLKAQTKMDGMRDFLVSLSVLRRPDTREIYGVLAVFNDVTDLRLAEQIRSEFVANASHELRTPLTSVKGYLETLKADFAAGQIKDAGVFLEIVSRNVDRLIDLVNDLLSLSSLEQPGSRLCIDEVHALAISDQVVSELSMLAAAKRQRIFISGDTPPFQGDVQKIEQVLRNLVSNAIKYIPEGSQIEIRWELDPAGATLLKVIDNGPGISPEHLPRLFERFYRVDRGRAREAGGTGLGLAIVKHIMQKHGGSVSVNSVPGRTEFVCRFPSTHERRPEVLI